VKDGTIDMSSPIRFLAVIGLYQTAAHQSATFQSLQEACSQLHCDRGRISILLYDNTPGEACSTELAPNVRNYKTGQNNGLAEAFNFGLEMAEGEDCDWLITLDQDTTLPINFLTRLAEIAERVKDDLSIAAIVPQICGDGRMLSPNWFWAGAIPRWFPKGFVGIPKHPTFAFNSASTLRVSALREIGGYSPWFWLDHSDSLLYYELNRRGKRIFLAGDLQVNHNFSMLDKHTRMSVSRYHNMLLAEAAFWDLAMNPLARMERAARLFRRWCGYAITGDQPAFRKETAAALKQRLFCSKASRLKFWKNEMRRLRPHLADMPEPFQATKRLNMRNDWKKGTSIG
jgi:GT2 family glycosyltransferase